MYKKITVGAPEDAGIKCQSDTDTRFAGTVAPVLVDGIEIGRISEFSEMLSCNWLPTDNAAGYTVPEMFCMAGKVSREAVLDTVDTLVVRQAERLAKGEPLTDNDKDPLDPHLGLWLVEQGIGLCLKHPLVFAVPYWPQQAPMYNAQFRHQQEQVEKVRANGEWESYIWLHERPYRLNALTKVMEHLSDQRYWELVGKFWTDSENIFQNFKIWRSLWSSRRPLRQLAMDAEEQAIFGGLAETVTIYRGYQYNASMRGMSWTVDRDRAIWFARRFARRAAPKLATVTVARSKILAYFDGRNESEVVVLPRDLKQVTSAPIA